VADAILKACRNDVKAYQIVYGSRQSGKTSLLLNIRHRLPPKVVTCWVDFQRLPNASTERVFHFLANQILKSINQAGSKYSISPKVVADGNEFDNWLMELSFEGRLVLLLEELGRLSRDTRIALGSMLRSMFNGRYETVFERVMVIFFGGIELFDMAVKELSPLENVCNKVFLPDLDLEQTVRLMKAGFQQREARNSPVDFEALGQAIYSQVEGHPYLSQRLGDLALTHLLKNRYQADAQVIEKYAGEMLENDDRNDRYFGNLYDTIQQYQLIDGCKRLSKALQYSDTDKHMIRLRLLGVAKEQNGECIVRNALLSRGLKTWLEYINQDGRLPLLSDTGMEDETRLAYENNEVQRLIRFLIEHPSLTNENSRRAVIILAGLEHIIPKLNLPGAAAESVPTLILSLWKHGRISEGAHALGLFLKCLADPLYSGLEQIRFLRDFIDKHRLIT
jgi:hypothetical protein